MQEAGRLLTRMGLDGGWNDTLTVVLALLLTAFMAWLGYVLCLHVVAPVLMRFARKTEMKWDDLLFTHETMKAASRVVPAVVLWQMLPAVFWHDPSVADILTRFSAIYMTVGTMMLGIAVVDSMKNYEHFSNVSLQQYLHTFCGVLKILIIFLALIVIVAIVVNRNPLTLIAGLGATSAILMLVFKDTISGVVAGIRLTSNDMLHRGDWITVPKADINGIVEEITLTTVKVRNFDNTILTITPQTLTDDSFQNWIGMRQGGGRRVKRMVYVDFRSIVVASDSLRERLKARYGFSDADMPDGVVNLTLYRKYMERYLRGRDDVNTDMMLIVRQLEATNAGLPIEFYFFLLAKDWVPYEHHLAEIMEQAYAIAPDFGITIYQRCSDQTRLA